MDPAQKVDTLNQKIPLPEMTWGIGPDGIATGAYGDLAFANGEASPLAFQADEYDLILGMDVRADDPVSWRWQYRLRVCNHPYNENILSPWRPLVHSIGAEVNSAVLVAAALDTVDTARTAWESWAAPVIDTDMQGRWSDNSDWTLTLEDGVKVQIGLFWDGVTLEWRIKSDSFDLAESSISDHDWLTLVAVIPEKLPPYAAWGDVAETLETLVLDVLDALTCEE